MGKVGLSKIFCAYVATLRDDSSEEEKTSYSDVALQLVIPVLIGIVSQSLFIFDIIECPDFGGFITVSATMSSLLCALALMLFELRRGMGSVSADKARERESRLIDELFADVMWCVVAGFATSLFMVVSDAARDSLPEVGQVAGSLALSAVTNFILVVCMCLKRMNAVYALVSRSWTRGSKLSADDPVDRDRSRG